MHESEVGDALRDVIDPELGINIVDLGLIYAIEVVESSVRITMTMTTPACPLREYIQDLVESAVTERFEEATSVSVDVVTEPPWSEEMMTAAARRQLA